ncbi:MAG: hypothetical protein EA412_02220 [Chitinophagaceae bacterium]|nr:MAG: hypothetical protein EA412_02220 [Chitinophagaceae bacterium]
MPENLILVSKPVDEIFILTESTGFHLFRHNLRANRLVEVDYSKYGRGALVPVSEILVEFKNQIPGEIRILGVSPEIVYLDFEALLERSVPIDFDYRLDFNQQFDVFGKISLSPDSITVSGPISAIDTIFSWPSKPFEKKNINKSLSGVIEMKKPENELISLSVERAEYNIPVERFTEKVFDIPVEVFTEDDDSEKSFSIFPRRVTLSCLLPVSRYEEVLASDFQVFADFSIIDVKSDKRVPVMVNTENEFARNIRVSPSRLEFIIYD